MLISVKVSGTADLQGTLLINIARHQTVKELLQMIQQAKPGLVPKRVLFAGKELSLNDRIDKYHIYKESTIQVVATKAEFDHAAVSEDAVTSCDQLIFGEFVWIVIREAHILHPKGSKMSCFIKIEYEGQSAKTQALKGSNPAWNECFGILVKKTSDAWKEPSKKLTKRKTGLSSSRSLSVQMKPFGHICVSIWDKGLLKNDMMGEVQMGVKTLPFNSVVEKVFDVPNAEKLTIKLTMRKVPIMCRDVYDRIETLSRLERCWKSSDFESHFMSLEKIFGDEPMDPELMVASGMEENPVLKMLRRTLESKKFRFSSAVSQQTITHFLKSQNLIVNSVSHSQLHGLDLLQHYASRYLFFSGISINQSDFLQRIYEIIKKPVKFFCFSKDPAVQ
jgi:hypothetical protein